MAIQSVTATFTGAEDNVTVAWTAMPGNYKLDHGVTVTDGLGPVFVNVTTRTATGCVVVPSARFTGTVEITVVDAP